jgi:hypothetical protein
MSFSVDVSKWAEKAQVEIEELRKAVIIELFSSVILDTPVDTGRLRGNWQIMANNPAKGELEVTDPEGRTTIKKVEDFAKGGELGQDQVVILTNNLPYAYRIEYDGWSHTKAPEGMVRKNFIRVSKNLKKQLV